MTQSNDAFSYSIMIPLFFSFQTLRRDGKVIICASKS